MEDSVEGWVGLDSLVEAARLRNVGHDDIVKLVFVFRVCVEELLGLVFGTNGYAHRVAAS